MFSAGDTGSVDAYLESASYLSSPFADPLAFSLLKIDGGHTAADAYKPSYQLMPIALGLMISLRPSFQLS